MSAFFVEENGSRLFPCVRGPPGDPHGNEEAVDGVVPFVREQLEELIRDIVGPGFLVVGSSSELGLVGAPVPEKGEQVSLVRVRRSGGWAVVVDVLIHP